MKRKQLEYAAVALVGTTSRPPRWIKPQLTRLADEAPAGSDWLHEVKYDGYRMHARLDGGKIQLLTRTGLDWSNRYPYTLSALRSLPAKTAYIDGELCALRPDGVPSFGLLQAAMDQGMTNSLVFFAFDLLFLDGKSTAALPLIERKQHLHTLFAQAVPGLHFTDHVVGNGPPFRQHACQMGLEGVISKRLDQPYAPGDRGLWVKSKCLNREEFVVVGWTDPTGSRPHIGALLLGYYTEDVCLLRTPKHPESLAFFVTQSYRHRHAHASVRPLGSLLSFRVRSRLTLELELVALRHQLTVLRRQRPGQPRLFSADRLLWVWLFCPWSRFSPWLVVRDSRAAKMTQ
jgi:bifunctional non-homologous end joining protein LigD